MTKELFDKIIAKAKGCPCVLIGDNLELFNINFEQHFYVQDEDFVYCIRTNTNPNVTLSQKEFPYEIMVFAYDEIQYIKVYPDRETLSGFIDGMDTVTDDMTLDEIKKAIFSSKVMAASSPRGNGEYRHEVFGDFPGLTVTIGKEPDKYTKEAMERENEANK